MINIAYYDEAKRMVAEYYNEDLRPFDGPAITENDVFIVWFCKTLQNWKALASTYISDGMYYEITYNGDKNETYVDAYRKVGQRVFSDN